MRGDRAWSVRFESQRILLRKYFVLVIFLRKLHLSFYYLFRKYDLRGFSGGNSVVTVFNPNKPLIEDLNHLWSSGELVYDAFTRSTFTLKAMLLWTISVFPAYGNLAGCKVKGKNGVSFMWEKHRQYVAQVQQKTCVYVPQKRSATSSYFLGKEEVV